METPVKIAVAVIAISIIAVGANSFYQKVEHQKREQAEIARMAAIQAEQEEKRQKEEVKRRELEAAAKALVAKQEAEKLALAKAEAEKIDKVKKLVLDQLKDPESAQFKEVFIHKQIGKSDSICGKVNAKNALGGYVGYRRFMMKETGESPMLEQGETNEVFNRAFEVAWQIACVEP